MRFGVTAALVGAVTAAAGIGFYVALPQQASAPGGVGHEKAKPLPELQFQVDVRRIDAGDFELGLTPLQGLLLPDLAIYAARVK